MTNPNSISHHTAAVNGVRLHYATAGEGEPLVLLHGWPQTWREWRHLIPRLATRFTVIAPDLRGFGHSDKPAGGYDKRTMAEDIHDLVRHLGFSEINLAGHDIGMMVAYEYAARFPTEVKRLAVMEAGLPGLGLEALMDAAKFPQYWHFGFFRAPNVAEALISGREKMFLSDFIAHLAHDPCGVTEDDLDEYARRIAAPGALRASFEVYRAFDIDAQNNQENARQPLAMPVLAVGGEFSVSAMVGKMMEPLAKHVQAAVVSGSGHWVPEERPDDLAEIFTDFFTRETHKEDHERAHS